MATTTALADMKTCRQTTETSPADRANDVLLALHRNEFPMPELYDRLQAVGLTPEEADEMCNLELSDAGTED